MNHRTALELTLEDWKAYQPAQSIRKRHLAAQPQLDRRYKRALRLARQAAACLRKDFGASRVVMFGSLASRNNFTLYSDIDLAAWGIPAGRFFCGCSCRYRTEHRIQD